MSTTTPTDTPAALTFDQCLDAIEQYRTGGCGGAAYKALLKTHGDAWKQADAAFETFKTDPARWNGQNAPAIGSALYNKIIKGLNFTADIMPHPFRTAFVTWASEKPYLRDYLKTIASAPNESVHYDLFRADMLEAFGQDLKAKGNSRMFADEKNNGYVTLNSDGKSWTKLSEEQVTQLIQSGDKGGPHVFMTANHAFLETMNDVAGTVDNYKKLIDTVTDDKTAKKKAIIGTYDQQPLTSKQTVIVVALSTRENNYLNLAQLFHRLHEVDVANDKGPETDQFTHASPTAKLMVRTILKSIVEDPTRITEGTGTPPSFISGDTPVILKPDAAEIIRNAQFHGFSKGGNDFRDGMRLLAQTLNRKLPDTQNLFQSAIPARDLLRDIVSNVSVTVQSMNEKPMHEWYKNRGVSVTYFANRHDNIALPPDIEHTERDPVIVYYGPVAGRAHHPNVITENLSHPYILQHYRCAMASLTDDPALRFTLFEKMDGRHCLVLKTAPGTTDAMMANVIDELETAFVSVGLVDNDVRKKILVKRIENAHGCERYELISTKGEEDLFSVTTIDKLNTAFDKIRNNPTVPIVVSSAITDPCLPTLKKDILTARGWPTKPGDRDFKPNEGWLDNIKITGGQVYDRRIAAINTFMGADPNLLPVDAPVPQMSETGGAARRV